MRKRSVNPPKFVVALVRTVTTVERVLVLVKDHDDPAKAGKVAKKMAAAGAVDEQQIVRKVTASAWRVEDVDEMPF